MGNFLPGQRLASTRRRLVREENPQGYGIVTSSNGSIWFQPFGPNGSVYSYPAAMLGGETVNMGNRAFWGGFYGFLAMGVAIASYSMWDLLIILTLSFGEAELANRNYISPLYGPVGFGISGINGWMAGYLIARLISKQRTWASFGGIMVLQGYIISWWKGTRVSHICHFVTMAQGFIAGLASEHFGPKQKPWKFARKHVGKFVIMVMVGHYALGAYLKKILPDPPGFENPLDPEVAKVKQAKHDRMVAEMVRRHEEDRRKYETPVVRRV
jgi:hypothetical protein